MAIVLSPGSYTFLDAVNRVLRINHIIKGDDDNVTSLSDTQHSADIEIAQIAIQSEITDLVANQIIGYELTSDSITLATGTQTYSLNSNFVRFYGERPSFYDATDNIRIYEAAGGMDRLRDSDYKYDTTQGSPICWYWYPGTSYKVGFYNIPDSSYNGRVLTYQYEKSVMVTNATDTMPFITTEAYLSFCDAAARRFHQIDNTILVPLEQDGIWSDSRSRLQQILRPTNPSKKYGRKHG